MRETGETRLDKMVLTSWNMIIVQSRSPWVSMWWSAALPGLGHLYQGSYLKGITLLFWEILVNLMGKLNLGIMYTFTGKFEQAVETVDPEWALLYGAIFCFAVFDSYRIRAEMNRIALIENKKRKNNYTFMKISAGGVQYLDRGNPWMAAVWSAFLPGFGHMYNMKTFKSIIILAWAIVIVLFSHINDAIIATFTGRFSEAGKVVDYQWLLFFPSIYMFAIWDSYNDAVEMNSLFAEEQRQYLGKMK